MYGVHHGGVNDACSPVLRGPHSCGLIGIESVTVGAKYTSAPTCCPPHPVDLKHSQNHMGSRQPVAEVEGRAIGSYRYELWNPRRVISAPHFGVDIVAGLSNLRQPTLDHYVDWRHAAKYGVIVSAGDPSISNVWGEQTVE